jgi:hypothetical protein
MPRRVRAEAAPDFSSTVLHLVRPHCLQTRISFQRQYRLSQICNSIGTSGPQLEVAYKNTAGSVAMREDSTNSSQHLRLRDRDLPKALSIVPVARQHCLQPALWSAQL